MGEIDLYGLYMSFLLLESSPIYQNQVKIKASMLFCYVVIAMLDWQIRSCLCTCICNAIHLRPEKNNCVSIDPTDPTKWPPTEKLSEFKLFRYMTVILRSFCATFRYLM